MSAPMRVVPSTSTSRGWSMPKWSTTPSMSMPRSTSIPGKAYAIAPPPLTRPSVVNQMSLRPRHAWPRATILRATASRLGVGSAMAMRTGPSSAKERRSVPARTVSSSSSAAVMPATSSAAARNSRVVAARSTPVVAPVDAGRATARAAGGRRRVRCRRVGLQHDVRVDAAEPERVDAGPARAVGGLPRLGPVDGAEAGPGEVRVRLVAVEGRGQDAVVDRERRLDEGGDPRRRHGVADHRLHRAQADRRGGRAVGAERPAQRGQLDGVAGGRGRAVGLDEPDGLGVEPGFDPGPFDGEALAAAVGAHERGGPAVARDAGSADHGVDAVVVALGVLEALEDDDAGALADEDAVGPAVERPDRAGRAQGTELAEHAPERHVVAVVDAAGEHQVAAAGRQLVDGLVDGDQRARAGGVDRVRRAVQVEAVGDA